MFKPCGELRTLEPADHASLAKGHPKTAPSLVELRVPAETKTAPSATSQPHWAGARHFTPTLTDPRKSPFYRWGHQGTHRVSNFQGRDSEPNTDSNAHGGYSRCISFSPFCILFFLPAHQLPDLYAQVSWWKAHHP